ncbi:MAG: tRNA (adenosine(37)-N6)-dimethylallyltransferase MiaA [Prevotellaceae bacterium]|nr:tRNA (adenosine(37)-N6)-dimethylallyltransferase MiaA [Prevotellaceae bacterium]
MMKSMITILGPTACGKTTFAAHLASNIGGEIISADSRQVYRAMDIGTGKDLDDYIVSGKKVPYHLIDIADAGEKYNVFRYQHDFLEAYSDIRSRNVVPVLCGGTGLYIESVLRGYHLSPVPQNQALRASLEGKTLEELTDILKGYKALHNTTDTDTVQRAIRAIEIEDYCAKIPLEDRYFPEIKSLVVGLDIERGLRREKITRRLKQRLDEGMVDEIRGLIEKGVSPDDLIYYGLEYKYLTLYVIGQMSYEEMVRLLEIAIHQFAKRQMTWFRGMERRGIEINWIDASLPMDERLGIVERLWNDYNRDKCKD